MPGHNLLSLAERHRLEASTALDPDARVRLGQYLTPATTAQLMASMFRSSGQESVSLLDAGAGVGSLTAAWIDELCIRTPRPSRITAVTYEVDPDLAGFLENTMDACRAKCRAAGIDLTTDIRIADFIERSVDILGMSMFYREPEVFDYAIVNPPYRKIRNGSRTRQLLGSVGIESTNLYTAFLSLILRLLGTNGELVMITPRSFCNGPYFRPFRRTYLATMATQRVHIYDSRKSAFKDDAVLQENVIFHAIKTNERPNCVVISSSSGPEAKQSTARGVPYHEFVSPEDPDSFIHIAPDAEESSIARRLRSLPATLESLGISVSTGRVVDFRARDWLRAQPIADTVPLIYPTHFDQGAIAWPKPSARKPNAIVDSHSTSELLVPNGTYVLAKRFSAKEERRRIVAAVYDGRRFSFRRVAFENHLNYFHMSGRGLEPVVARGLALFLNSTLVDRYFRQFNGHTQVNANDLRSLRYPAITQLRRLGSSTTPYHQASIDAIVESAVPLLEPKTTTL